MSPAGNDARRHAPAAGRNRAPIRAALAPLLAGRRGVMLEIGSGSGEHVVDWAAAFPDLDWQPSDPDPGARASIAAWASVAAPANLRPPLALDACAPWPVDGPLAGVIAVNVIHIAPWAVAEALIDGAGARLAQGGLLVLYGPFREAGAHTAPSNAAFDTDLRARNPDWGVRDLEDVAAHATAAGFGRPTVHVMPANNRLIAFVRDGAAAPSRGRVTPR